MILRNYLLLEICYCMVISMILMLIGIFKVKIFIKFDLYEKDIEIGNETVKICPFEILLLSYDYIFSQNILMIMILKSVV